MTEKTPQPLDIVWYHGKEKAAHGWAVIESLSYRSSPCDTYTLRVIHTQQRNEFWLYLVPSSDFTIVEKPDTPELPREGYYRAHAGTLRFTYRFSIADDWQFWSNSDDQWVPTNVKWPEESNILTFVAGL